MKQRRVLYYTISAIVYLGVIIGGYSLYNVLKPNNEKVEEDHSEHTTNPLTEKDDHSNHAASPESEVTTTVNYENNILTIMLKDKNQKAPTLELNHEKRMHLIVVSSDLMEYYHVHPTDKGAGVFEQNLSLKDNSYKAFVDIKPKGLNYEVKPNEIHVGEKHSAHGENQLVVDKEFTKTVNNKQVELKIDSLVSKQPTTLSFDIKNGTPEPYLGALGHVVILDKAAENFIHVHPASDKETIFKTQFETPGIYKIWAEFKFENEVHVYPYIVEVK